jgi:hypothetical protein
MVRNQKLKMSCGGSTVLGVLLLLLATCLYNICKCRMQGFRMMAVHTVRMRKAKTNILGRRAKNKKYQMFVTALRRRKNE